MLREVERRAVLLAHLKVRVGAARAVDADVARHGDMRASVRLAHDCHHSDLSNVRTLCVCVIEMPYCNRS